MNNMFGKLIKFTYVLNHNKSEEHFYKSDEMKKITITRTKDNQ